MVHEGGWQLLRSDGHGMITVPPVSGYYAARAPTLLGRVG
jgi:hypothetical protein